MNFVQIGVSNIRIILNNIKASLRLIRNSAVESEFRTTKIPGVHSPEVLDILSSSIGPDKKLTLNEFRDGDILENYLS